MDTITPTVRRSEYDSLGDMLDVLERGGCYSGWHAVSRERASQGPGRGWYGEGSDSFAAAARMARQGWPAGRNRMREALAKAAAYVVPNRAPAWQLDVAGARPMVAAAIAGDPLCMWTPNPDVPAGRPTVEIMVNATTSSGVDAQTIERRGAAILAEVDRMEDAGLSVELSVCWASRSKMWTQRQHLSVVRCKKAGEPLDIDRAAFALIHPSMQRRLFFADLERMCGLPEQTNWTSGYERTYGTVLDFPGTEGMIYVPSCHSAYAAVWASAELAAKAMAKIVDAAELPYARRDMPGASEIPSEAP
jgi:hypothetical protein